MGGWICLPPKKLHRGPRTSRITVSGCADFAVAKGAVNLSRPPQLRCDAGSVLRLDATKNECTLELANASHVENICEASRGQLSRDMSTTTIMIMISMVTVVLLILGCCLMRGTAAGRQGARKVSAEDPVSDE